MKTTEKTYNGWKNYETWNVALWIQNDEGFYDLARGCDSYEMFKEEASGTTTPDGISWYNSTLDIDALDRLLEDL